jgi:DNA invertase Pin-like site-specific DNA recombinase
MSTAWSYLVVSSEQQAETLDFQQRWSEETATANAWTVTRTFRGVSTGKYGTRKLLEELLGELRATPKPQRPKRILMVRLDRTGRGLGLEALAALAEIHALGVTVHTREDGDVALSRASDVLKPVLRILQGALENEVRADRSRAGHRRRREKGLHRGNAPFGAILIDGKPAAYEPEAQLVRTLFRLRVDRAWGYDRLARFAAEHAPPKRLLDGREKPLRWGRGTIQRMLQCETLRGVVVDAQLYDEAQATRNPDFKTARVTSWPWPLAGAVRCVCGGILSGQCSGPRHARTRYYVCRHIERHGRYPYHRADRVEAQFVELLGRLSADPNALVRRSSEAIDVGALHDRERQLRAQLAQLDARRRHAWELAHNETLTGEQLREQLDEIDAERKTKGGELESIARAIVDAGAASRAAEGLRDVLVELSEVWETSDVVDRQESARAVAACVGGIWLHPDHPGTLIIGHDAAVDAIVDVSENMRTIVATIAALAAIERRRSSF